MCLKIYTIYWNDVAILPKYEELFGCQLAPALILIQIESPTCFYQRQAWEPLGTTFALLDCQLQDILSWIYCISLRTHLSYPQPINAQKENWITRTRFLSVVHTWFPRNEFAFISLKLVSVRVKSQQINYSGRSEWNRVFHDKIKFTF